jgi:tetratricopeptide (TPR) repeat protein
MSSSRSNSKIITVTLNIQDVKNDTFFFNFPGEIENTEEIKNAVLKMYDTKVGILEGFVDDDKIIIQWYPENIIESAEALHREAIILAKEKQYDMAIEKWKQAISLNSEDVDYLYKLGLIYFEMKNYQESIQYTEKAIQICPIHHRAYLILGIDWIKLRKFDQAEINVLASNRLNKSNLMSYLNLGAIYSVQKKYNDAIEMFKKTTEINPSECRAYLGLAKIYSMLNDVEAANEYFRKVIEKAAGTEMAEYAKRSIKASNFDDTTPPTSSKNREEYLARGVMLYLAGNYAKAESIYKQYLKNRPSDTYAWYLLGESKLKSSNIGEASDCFKRAVRLNPKKSLYLKSLGLTLHLLGKSDEAVEILKRSIEMGKKDPLCYTLYGINLMRQRKLDEAIQNYKLALKKNPNNLLAMYNMALALIQKNEKHQASEILDQITSFEIFSPIKKQAKKLLKNIEYSE